ncbi:MAG: tetratricopeptide repeat protein, partial [Chloroflexi bacterium]
MGKIEKTVFISYRRDNYFQAKAVYDYLVQKGYNVFLDYHSIKSGDFEQVILGSIKSRAHFVLVLTAATLLRCKDNPNDWVRREIEAAIQYRRNIVPLYFEGFEPRFFDQYLPPDLAKPMKNYQAQKVPNEFFEAAMEKLLSRLQVSVDAVIHPASSKVEAYEVQQKAKLPDAPAPTPQNLSAEEFFSRGLQHQNLGNHELAIQDYTEAIRLRPDYAYAYNNRGVTYNDLGDHQRAIQDYDRAIHLDPNHAIAYNNRGLAYNNLGDYQRAIQDYNRAIQLDPNYALAYNNRG